MKPSTTSATRHAASVSLAVGTSAATAGTIGLVVAASAGMSRASSVRLIGGMASVSAAGALAGYLLSGDRPYDPNGLQTTDFGALCGGAAGGLAGAILGATTIPGARGMGALIGGIGGAVAGFLSGGLGAALRPD